jgi:hypothetical protein
VNGWAKGGPLTAQMVTNAWVPYSAEMAVDLIGWPVEQVREVFGDTVLVRQTLGGLEFGRPDPAPDSREVRDEVNEIIERGIVSTSEFANRFFPAPFTPDAGQLLRDLIAARDGAWSA